MRNEQSITKTLEQWKQGELDINGLWYDWFCKNSSLENKGARLLQKLKAIQKSPKFDPDKTYVFLRITVHALVASTMILESAIWKTVMSFTR